VTLGAALLWAPASLPLRWRVLTPLAPQDAGMAGVRKNAQGNQVTVVSRESVSEEDRRVERPSREAAAVGPTAPPTAT
jgi:hypothetical protein